MSAKPTPTERSRASEARRLAAGGRNLRIILSPEASAALQRLQWASGMNAAKVIQRALLDVDGLATALRSERPETDTAGAHEDMIMFWSPRR